MRHFEMNGKAYQSDAETVKVLKSIEAAAKESGDTSAVAAVMALGLESGRIKEIKNVKNYIKFKIEQHIRLAGFDVKQAGAQAKLAAIVKANLKSWTLEAIQAGY